MKVPTKIEIQAYVCVCLPARVYKLSHRSVSHRSPDCLVCPCRGVHGGEGRGGGGVIDGLVCSVLAPAVRSAAQQTATCLHTKMLVLDLFVSRCISADALRESHGSVRRYTPDIVSIF